jgi:hypothetical protein
MCQVSKPSNHQPYGLLETLDIPSHPWETVGIDFVGPLPESKTLHGVFDMMLLSQLASKAQQWPTGSKRNHCSLKVI